MSEISISNTNSTVLKMEESQTIKNGRVYLNNKQTIMLGICPGNPFFCNLDNRQRRFHWARDNAHQKVNICIIIDYEVISHFDRKFS